MNCPYCQKMLEKIPKRKTRCTHCGKDIFVRTKQSIFPTHLLRKEEALAVDFVKELELFDVTEDDFKQLQEEFLKRGGAKATDVMWSLLQQLNMSLMARGDLHGLSMLNYTMSRFLNKEGRSHYDVLLAAHQYDLKERKTEGYKRVEIITAGEQSCVHCQRLQGKCYDLNEAMQHSPLPCKECTHMMYNEKYGFCRCFFVTEGLPTRE